MLEVLSRIYSNGAKIHSFSAFPLSHSLNSLCLFQLLNLKEGHFIDKQEETFPNVSHSMEHVARVGLLNQERVYLGLLSSSALKLALEQSLHFSSLTAVPF